jgi:hypothetical protein
MEHSDFWKAGLRKYTSTVGKRGGTNSIVSYFTSVIDVDNEMTRT